MIREVGESIGRAVLDGVGRAASRIQERKALAVDVLENDEAYLVVFDAPGASAGDIEVRYDENAVSVQIDRFREFHDGYEMRFPGRGLTLSGKATLPRDAEVDPDAAEATVTNNGTLEVLVPKVRPDVGEDDGEQEAEIPTQDESGDV